MPGDPLAFDTTKCPVDPVTKIPDGGLLTDGTVPDAPDAITDCQLTPIVNLPQEIPCPDVTITSAVIVQGIREDSSVITTPAINFTVTRGLCCEFDFDLYIEIPDVVCPTITSNSEKGKAVSVTTGEDGALPEGYLYLTVSKDAESCSFDFDTKLDFTFSCPSLTSKSEEGTAINVSTGADGALPEGYFYLTVSKGAQDCTYDFDGKIDITFSCPSLTSKSEEGTAINVATGTDGALPEGYFYLTISKGSQDCTYDFDTKFDITFSCPSLNSKTEKGTAVGVSTGTDGALPEGYLYLTISKGAQDCTYDFDTKLDLTFSCPSIDSKITEGTPITVSTGTDGALPEGYLYLSVSKGAQDCTYDFDGKFDLTFSCPGITTNTKNTPVSIGYSGVGYSYGDITVTINKTTDCNFEIDTQLDLYLTTEGVQGYFGFQGYQGFGFQGYQGFGFQGYQGFGFQGYQGFGFQGYQGLTGSYGPQGDFGYQGYQGFGYQGYQGFGYQGYQGFGYQGYQGFGYQGFGFQGAQGFYGNQGFTGAQGYQGAQGFQGAQGYQALPLVLEGWSQNSQNDNGKSGKSDGGSSRDIGFKENSTFPYTGPTKYTPYPGRVSHNAWQIDAGTFASDIEIEAPCPLLFGTNDDPDGGTGEPNEIYFETTDWLIGYARINVTKVEDECAYNIDLAINAPTPRLIPSDPLDPPLHQEAGKYLIQTTKEAEGYIRVTTGEMVPGLMAVSAELFLPEGYQGFGFQGTQGYQGYEGYYGPQGIQGYQGYIGYDGPQGIQGPQGYIGYDGPQGIQGYQGSVGYYGPQGTQGYQGFEGYYGPQGIQGPQGYIGYGGDYGTQGPQGYAGYGGDYGAQGPQGYIGYGGDYGAQGPQGYIGYDGGYGTQGPQGYIGYEGDYGTQGPQGYIGYTGDYGAQGPQGYIGYDGPQGIQGPQGYAGYEGDYGTQGPQGYAGYDGDYGTQGPQGYAGYDGDYGTQGPQGYAGYEGDYGTQGPQGYAGYEGDYGAQGPQGYIGYEGGYGTQGPQGYAGYDGDYGTQGPQGYAGYEGDYGTQGPQGYAGYDGPQGIQGPQGYAGYEGDYGTQGPQGYAGYEGDYGTQGPQGYTGYEGAYGPQGPEGYPGDVTGPQGPQGVPGYTGNYGSQGSQGFSGYSGEYGTQGTQGPSGYAGFGGAYGPQGPTGYDGYEGAYGPQGPEGYPGDVTGPQGPQGVPGYTGNYGSQGSQGFGGYDGPYGSQGAQGFSGYGGTTGSQGSQGYSGYPGTAGNCGGGDSLVITVVTGVSCVNNSIQVTTTQIAIPGGVIC